MKERPEKPPIEDMLGTCDWGFCDAEAHSFRWADDYHEWLTVCEKHSEKYGLPPNGIGPIEPIAQMQGDKIMGVVRIK